MKQTLSDAERTQLDKQIAETEKQTGAQIVLASVERSDSYAEIPWKAFAIGVSGAALLVLILDRFVVLWQTGVLVLLSVAVILATGALLAFLTMIFPGFARLFLSSGRRETECMQYAESLFLSNELFSTEGRRGILLMVSQFEREVVILPDTGAGDRLGTAVLEEIIAGMTMHLRKKELREALETGLERIREALGPPDTGQGGKNELSDRIIEEEGA